MFSLIKLNQAENKIMFIERDAGHMVPCVVNMWFCHSDFDKE